MSWHCSRALVEDCLDRSRLGGRRFAQLRSIRSADLYCAKDKTKDYSRFFRFGTTCEPLTESLGADLLTLFLEAFPVKTYLAPERGTDCKENDPGYGTKWRESFATFDRVSFSWKTPQRSLFGGYKTYSDRLPNWGSMRNGELYLRRTPELPICESAFGSLPTPAATHYGTNRGGRAGRSGKVRPSLETMARAGMLPTPNACDATRGSPETDADKKARGANPGRSLIDVIGGPLNPDFVEWLMGWPVGWTDLERSEMGKFHNP